MPTHADNDAEQCNSPILVADGLGRRVGDRWLWQDLSFELRPGETLAVSGPSGSGKTLLLRVLALLDHLDAGSVALRGRATADWSVPVYRARVLYLHQRPALWDGTVEENFARPFHFRSRHDRAYDRDRAARLLASVGRPAAMLDQPVDRLSGGESQIVALVRALLVEPSVLLLDEPTASLDDEAALRVETLLAGWKTGGPERAIVWVSHSPTQRDRVADRRLVLAENGNEEEAR